MLSTAPVEPVFLWRARTCSIAGDMSFWCEVVVNILERVKGIVRKCLDLRSLYNLGGGWVLVGHWLKGEIVR